jgi:hypothetical protein
MEKTIYIYGVGKVQGAGAGWTGGKVRSLDSGVQGAACRLVGKMQVHMPLTESAG